MSTRVTCRRVFDGTLQILLFGGAAAMTVSIVALSLGAAAILVVALAH